MLTFLAPINSSIEGLKTEIIRYFGSKGVADELKGFPAIIINDYNVGSDQTFISQFVNNTDIVILVIENVTEDFISGFCNKNFIYLQPYGTENS